MLQYTILRSCGNTDMDSWAIIQYLSINTYEDLVNETGLYSYRIDARYRSSNGTECSRSAYSSKLNVTEIPMLTLGKYQINPGNGILFSICCRFPTLQPDVSLVLEYSNTQEMGADSAQPLSAGHIMKWAENITDLSNYSTNWFRYEFSLSFDKIKYSGPVFYNFILGLENVTYWWPEDPSSQTPFNLQTSPIPVFDSEMLYYSNLLFLFFLLFTYCLLNFKRRVEPKAIKTPKRIDGESDTGLHSWIQ